MRAVLIPVAAAALAAGCAAAASPVFPPGSPAPAASTALAAPRTPAVTGGTATERALLRRIAAGQRTSQIVRLELSHVHGGMKLTATLAGSPTAARGDTLGDWETWIVGGAFRDRSAALGLPRVVLVGNQNESGSATGGPDLPHRGPGGLAAFRRRVAAAAAGPGARLIAVRVGDPDGYTAIVALEVSDPAAFLRHRLRPLDARLQRVRADGAYVVLYEPGGRVLYSEGGSGRLLNGVGGPRDARYLGCVPDQMTGLGGTLPPCPAT